MISSCSNSVRRSLKFLSASATGRKRRKPRWVTIILITPLPRAEDCEQSTVMPTCYLYSVSWIKLLLIIIVMFVLEHPPTKDTKCELLSLCLSNSVAFFLTHNDIPMGDMGSLCPSYAFSFSTLLLTFLLLREADTLSIAAPNRMVNCWVGFGLSSCPTNTHGNSHFSSV